MKWFLEHYVCDVLLIEFFSLRLEQMIISVRQSFSCSRWLTQCSSYMYLEIGKSLKLKT